jgi:DNA-binding LytR/AlgR family response regulator
MANALIVDDENAYLDRLGYELGKMGFSIYSASDADEARRILNAVAVDLFIVDILLPNRASGLELAESVRKSFPSTSIVIITGHSRSDYRARSEDVGALDYLEKPFELSAVRRCVRQFFKEQELLREIHRLEQQLAASTARDDGSRPLDAWAVAYLSLSGEVLYMTPDAAVVLDAISGPELSRPIRTLESPLVERIRAAATRPAGSKGVTTLFRRDGMASHYTALVQEASWNGRPAYGILFLAPEEYPVQRVDDGWLDLFLGPALTSSA